MSDTSIDSAVMLSDMAQYGFDPLVGAFKS